MIDPLPVIIPEAGRAAELARVVLSSLPLSYASNGEHGSGAVIIIDGQTTAWPDVAAKAIKESAAGAVVIEPQPAELGPLLFGGIERRIGVGHRLGDEDAAGFGRIELEELRSRRR